MPIEIRELIIEANVAPPEEQQQEDLAGQLTSEEMSSLKQEVIASITSDGVLTSTQLKELKEEILREVRKMMEDNWRR
jgi:hypothetical protein